MDGSINSPNELAKAFSFSGNMVSWTGSTTIQYLQGGWLTTKTVETMLHISLTDSGNNPIIFNADGGIALGALADVKPAAGSGGINVVVEAFAKDIGSLNWTPFLDYYDSHQTTGHYVRMSFNDGFYYEAVPISGAVWPLSPGLLGSRTR